MRKVECRVPDQKSEHWSIESFEVKEDDFQRMLFNFRNPGRGVAPGKYKRLMYLPSQDVMMSNTPAEIMDHWGFIREARGHVLVNGLGLGIVLEMLLAKPEVTKITVIEKDSEIIDLVKPHFDNEDRVEIVHDDAFTYQPPQGVRYDAVWHDIWLNITSDNLEEMKKLHRKYGRKTDWQGSWCRDECERIRREDQRYAYY